MNRAFHDAANRQVKTLLQALLPLFLVGCSQYTADDVADARQAVEEERQETEQVRQDAQQAIEEEQQETSQVAREVQKPILNRDDAEAIEEERRETAEVRERALEEIKEEERETEAAQEAADDVEEKYQAQEARDAYLRSYQKHVELANKKIESLQASDDDDEARQKAIEQEVAEIEKRRDALSEALESMEDSELANWRSYRRDVEDAATKLEHASDSSSDGN